MMYGMYGDLYGCMVMNRGVQYCIEVYGDV